MLIHLLFYIKITQLCYVFYSLSNKKQVLPLQRWHYLSKCNYAVTRNEVCTHWFIHGLLFAEPAIHPPPPPPHAHCISLSLSRALPAAAILECWMWRREAGTGDERRRGEIGKTEKNSNWNYSQPHNWKDGLFTDNSRLLLPVKPTETSQTSPGPSQRK